jgi:hypothetical protein
LCFSCSSSNYDGDPLAVAILVAETLAANNISYAIGGSLALAAWAKPRFTSDVDINAFGCAKSKETLFNILESQFGVDKEDAALQLEHNADMLQFYVKGVRVALFCDTLPVHADADRGAQLVTIDGHTVRFLSKEHLCVFKSAFNRYKDLADMELLMEVNGSTLDRRKVRELLVQLYGKSTPHLTVVALVKVLKALFLPQPQVMRPTRE